MENALIIGILRDRHDDEASQAECQRLNHQVNARDAGQFSRVVAHAEDFAGGASAELGR